MTPDQALALVALLVPLAVAGLVILYANHLDRKELFKTMDYFADRLHFAKQLDAMTRHQAAALQAVRYSRHLDGLGDIAACSSQLAAHARRLLRHCEAVQRAVSEREAGR